jgi:hypothetical protein
MMCQSTALMTDDVSRTDAICIGQNEQRPHVDQFENLHYVNN